MSIPFAGAAWIKASDPSQHQQRAVAAGRRVVRDGGAAVVRVRLHVGPPQSWVLIAHHSSPVVLLPWPHAPHALTPAVPVRVAAAAAADACRVRVHDGPADAAGHASMIRGRVLACKGRFALLACISGSIEFGYTTPPIHHHRSNSP